MIVPHNQSTEAIVASSSEEEGGDMNTESVLQHSKWIEPRRLRMRSTCFMVMLGVVLSLTSIVGSAGAGGLEVGSRAPDFELPGSDGETYRLADFRGEQVVVLAWFPKAFTGG